MNRVYNIKKEELENLFKEGKTTREIGKLYNISNTTISKYIRQYNLQGLYKKPKYNSYHLNDVTTKEVAYMLGFIIADGAINNELVEISVKIEDVEILELFSSLLGLNYHIDNTIIKEKRRFPRVRIIKKLIGINKFIGKDNKKNRNVPIIHKQLEVYLLRGIFDADGCITWGYRKDRNRLWHKVSFTSSLSILTSIQKVLFKLGITTMVRPKSNEDCYVLEFANKKDIIIFYNYLYKDTSFIPLKRKFDNFNALRLELGEFNGTTSNSAILSSAVDLSTECAETTGELNGTLNNQSSTQDYSNK